jgi:hypothetical protein
VQRDGLLVILAVPATSCFALGLPPCCAAPQDTDDIDFLLSMSMSEFGSCIFQLLSTVIFIAVVQPWILVGIGPLAVIYYFLQKYYRWVPQCRSCDLGPWLKPRL